MDTLLTEAKLQQGSLSLGEASELLWEWRKYRNEVFWNSIYRWGALVVALTIVPYLLPGIIRELGLAVLVFPVLAFVLAMIAAYVLIVQYMLYKLTDRKFRALLGPYNPGDIPDRPSNRLFRISIGKVLAGIFLCFGIGIELLNALLLAWLVKAG